MPEGKKRFGEEAEEKNKDGKRQEVKDEEKRNVGRKTRRTSCRGSKWEENLVQKEKEGKIEGKKKERGKKRKKKNSREWGWDVEEAKGVEGTEGKKRRKRETERCGGE